MLAAAEVLLLYFEPCHHMGSFTRLELCCELLGSPALVQDFFTWVWAWLQACVCSRHPSAPSSLLLSLQGETLVSPRYEPEECSWCPLILSLAGSHAFIPVQGTWRFPSSFAPSFTLRNSARAVFIQMKPCHFACVHLNTEKTPWNEITDFVSCQNTDCSYCPLWVQSFSE